MLETVAHYLKVLEQAYLVAGLEKYSPRLSRRRSAPPKIVVLNNGLMAALQDPGFSPQVPCSRERADGTIAGVRLMFRGDFLLGKTTAGMKSL